MTTAIKTSDAKKILSAIDNIRKDFPVLRQKVYGHPLIYLDNAATTQKPRTVINRVTDFYRNEYATVHRGVYKMSQDSTQECEKVRNTVRDFLGAKDRREIIFVRGATEAINLVAASYGRKFIKSGSEILISQIEHHANIVPWQELCKEKGCVLKVCPVNDRGEIVLEEFQELLSSKTALVAVGHVSNALGTNHPIRELIQMTQKMGAKILIDGAQAVPHLAVNVSELDCDFYCFSGHKVYGPTGVGVLYGKYEILEKMDPYQTGGDMIETVTMENTTFTTPPQRFEAGTPQIAEIVGLGPALDYLSALGLDNIAAYEQKLLDYATEQLLNINGIRIIGTATNKTAIVSFVFKDVHPHDIGTVMDTLGIAIRVGHHCAQPTMKRFGVPATARASFSFYNTKDEIDQLVFGLRRVEELFS